MPGFGYKVRVIREATNHSTLESHHNNILPVYTTKATVVFRKSQDPGKKPNLQVVTGLDFIKKRYVGNGIVKGKLKQQLKI